jgi:hypothetical protein
MRIGQLTSLGFYLNGAQGTEKYNHISIEKIKQELEKGSLFQFLEEELGSDIDTSILSEEDKLALNAEWLDISQVTNERRKMCVENGGLCLLIAYIFESIQRLNNGEN